MTTELPAEAIEAAARTICGGSAIVWQEGTRPDSQKFYRNIARDALKAAAPFIRAQALEEAADAMEADTTFRDPLRLRADWLRNRAKQERGEG